MDNLHEIKHDRVVAKQSELDKLVEDNPNVPAEIFEIEESQKMAELFNDMFGY